MMKIKCVKNGIELGLFNSIVEAAKAYDVNESSIRRVLDKPGRKSCGLEWITYKEHPEPISDKRVLIIGDLHSPFTKKGYFEHCVSIKNKYDCNTFVFIGDIVDNHYSSFHDADPDGLGAGEEIRQVKVDINKWYKEFPNAKMCIGNHDAIPNRKAFNAGLSKHWIKSIQEVFGLWSWDFQDSFNIDGVLYEHGLGGKAAQRSKRELVSLVQGHYHTDMYIHYTVGSSFIIFGMQVGCGIDNKSYAMAYSKYFPKPAIACGVVLDKGRMPILEPMML